MLLHRLLMVRMCLTAKLAAVRAIICNKGENTTCCHFELFEKLMYILLEVTKLKKKI